MAAFILEITTTSASETVVIPGTGGGYNYDIDWGDGISDLSQTTNSPSHVYASAGTYDVAISGTFPRVYYNNGVYKSQLTGIVQWGDENTWSTDQTSAFYGCSNLTGSIPGDTSGPFSNLIDGTSMFQNASISGALPSGMTLASLITGSNMFRDASISGALPSGMTLASLITGNRMFRDTSLSDPLPSGMTLASLTNGTDMFYGSPISGALPSGMTLASLSTATRMFRDTSISGALPSGMTLANLSIGTQMFRNTLIDAVFYSPLLKAMEANNSNNSVDFSAGTAKYWDGDAATARAALVARGWTFTDQGEDTGVNWTNEFYDITGDFAVNDDTIWPKSTGTITLSGGASQFIDFNGQSVEPIEINKNAANNLVTLTGPVNSERITLNTGTLDLNDTTCSTSVGGQVSLLVVAGNTIQDSGVGKNGAFDLAGTIALNGASGNLITWTDVDITALGAGVNTASWSSITNSTNSSGNIIDATDNCIDGGGNTGWNFAQAPPEITLVIQDAVHTHEVDNVGLVQANQLTLEDTEHSHTVDGVSLTQANELNPANTEHAHEAEGINLIQANQLDPSDTEHTHESENVKLSSTGNLSPENTEHTHQADNVALAQENTLSVADAEHSQIVDSLNLIQQRILAPESTEHKHITDGVILDVGSIYLDVNSVEHSHTADGISLTQFNILGINSAEHGHQADNIALSSANFLSVNSTEHGHTVEELGLTVENLLEIQEAIHTHQVDSAELIQQSVLVVSDALHTHLVNNVILPGTYFAAGRLLYVQSIGRRILKITGSKRIIYVAK